MPEVEYRLVVKQQVGEPIVRYKAPLEFCFAEYCDLMSIGETSLITRINTLLRIIPGRIHKS